LAYTDITIGQGRRILPGDIVQVYYTGSFAKNGGGGVGLPPQLSSFFGGGKAAGGAGVTVFDSIQEDDGAPFSFPVGKGQVIEGWDLGILGKVTSSIPYLPTNQRSHVTHIACYMQYNIYRLIWISHPCTWADNAN
jgi:hypothetical protein